MIKKVILTFVLSTMASLCFGQAQYLLDLSLEELLELEIRSPAALTDTTKRREPAAVTTITEGQIKSAAARSLYELLDIYVPNLQWIRHNWEADHLGARGIINDRDDKYLLLVNGRVLNERTHYGVMSEIDLVLLSDIHHIDVIRGPGSALYGPGAISMVVNITTYNGANFNGTEITTRLGALEEFYTAEVKHGKTFGYDSSLFLYAGIGRYLGADKDAAPVITGFDFPDRSDFPWDPANPGIDLPSEGQQAGEPFYISGMPKDGESHRNLLPIKLYAEFNFEEWVAWARYTRGGKQFVWPIGPLTHYPYGWGVFDTAIWDHPYSSGYQQGTLFVGRVMEVSEKTKITFDLSYDLFDFQRITVGLDQAYREDEFNGKMLLTHHLNDQHQLAIGVSLIHEEYGIESPGFSDEAAGLEDESPRNALIESATGERMPRWHSNMISLFGEHQWHITEGITSFVGVRFDDHTYTDLMFSPRVSIVFAPKNNLKDTWKLMWARSVRANFAEEMKVQSMTGGGKGSEPEKLDSLELRYERQENENLFIAVTLFSHHNLDLIGYSPMTNQNVPVGRQKDWGMELEAIYQSEIIRWTISHGYTELSDFDLELGQDTLVTDALSGAGDDFAQWSNHVTKLTGQYNVDDAWAFDGSLRVYWGFPGMKEYNKTQNSPRGSDGVSVIESGWDRAYRGNYYLNLGVKYQPNERIIWRLDGYNLLGIFDKDLNKRNYLDGFGMYRSHASSAGITLEYKL